MSAIVTTKQASAWAEIWTTARESGMSFSDAQQIADDLCRELPILDQPTTSTVRQSTTHFMFVAAAPVT